MISDKVRPHHLERKAILYVRQSSAHQVLHNRESSGLQYAMRDRLTALGWSEIEVIDDDLGRSAAGGVQRAGFERMVAAVCLGKVGAVSRTEQMGQRGFPREKVLATVVHLLKTSLMRVGAGNRPQRPRRHDSAAGRPSCLALL